MIITYINDIIDNVDLLYMVYHHQFLGYNVLSPTRIGIFPSS